MTIKMKEWDCGGISVIVFVSVFIFIFVIVSKYVFV